MTVEGVFCFKVPDIILICFVGVRCRLCFVILLKGGAWLGHKIIDEFQNPHDCVYGYLGISSYGDGTESKELKVTYDLDLNPALIKDSEVWIIDDVLDRCRADRGVTTMLGRRRAIDGVRDRDARRQRAARKQHRDRPH